MPTPYVSPLMATLKKDNSVRLCLDARFLNSIMEKEYDTPRPIEEIMNSIRNVVVMSSLDFTSGYYQIPLTEESQKFTGFKFEGKTYCFKVLPFGLASSVSAFTRCLSKVFGSEYDSFLVRYVDDLLIISQSVEEHLVHIDRVLTRLSECGFTLRADKCLFFREEMPFLGYVLNNEGYKPDPRRIQAVTDFRVPSDRKEVQSFLGLLNFDRAFCENFAEIAAPLTRLLRSKTKWRWGTEELVAFERLKHELAKETLLYHPREDIPFSLATDACDNGLGTQLFQIVNGKHRVVAWASRLLLDREKKYHINEKEALCVVWAVSRFRVYLLGKKFKIFTDNATITYLQTCRLLSPRIARYALVLQEYDFELVHVPSSGNFIADTLSRQAATRLPTPSDKMFKVLTVLKLSTSFQNKLKDIAELQRADNKLNDNVQKVEPDEKLKLRFVVRNGVLYTRRQEYEYYLLCIPKSLVEETVQEYHSVLGHFGVFKTCRALKNDVWWTNMNKSVKKVIKRCDICQRAKSSPKTNAEFCHIIPEGKNQLVAVDFYGPLPVSRGGVTYIFVVLDVFSKLVTCYALKRATTCAILNRLIKDYFVKHGVVWRVMNDQGTQFTAGLWRSRLAECGVTVIHTSVRHPQANPVERVMRELGRLCRTFCHDHHRRWAYELAHFTALLNRAVHESTGFSPNELHYGKAPEHLLPKSVIGSASKEPAVDMGQRLILAKEILMNRAERRKNKSCTRGEVFKVDDLVLLRACNVSSAIKSETKKFLLLYEGPYKIKKKLHTNTYLLEYCEGKLRGKERGYFHVSHLKLFHGGIE